MESRHMSLAVRQKVILRPEMDNTHLGDLFTWMLDNEQPLVEYFCDLTAGQSLPMGYDGKRIMGEFNTWCSMQHDIEQMRQDLPAVPVLQAG